ncbi:hypothetical protein VTN02DRAFT_5740 [Thermoascus thermophilus]
MAAEREMNTATARMGLICQFARTISGSWRFALLLWVPVETAGKPRGSRGAPSTADLLSGVGAAISQSDRRRSEWTAAFNCPRTLLRPCATASSVTTRSHLHSSVQLQHSTDMNAVMFLRRGSSPAHRARHPEFQDLVRLEKPPGFSLLSSFIYPFTTL